MKWLLFALQNLGRNRRRSGVTALIVAIGTAAVLLAAGFALQTYESLAQAAARTTGHLILATPARFESEEDVPLQHGIDDWQATARTLLADPAVRTVLPSVSFSGLVSNGEKSAVTIALGVDPDAEFAVKGPFLTVLDGKVLSGSAGAAGSAGSAGAADAAGAPGAPGVMLGEGLARTLKARPGAGLTLLATTTEGAMNALDVSVGAIVSTGITEIDKRLLYADLGTAQRLLDSQRVSTLGVFLARMDDTDAAAARIAAAHPSLALRTWQDEAVFYRSVRNLYNRIFGALGVIIAAIVVAVVAHSTSMSIIERTREIGTLRAIGTLPAQLAFTLALEGSILGAIGAAIGALVALGVAVLLLLFPVQMPPPPGWSISYPLTVAVDAGLTAIVLAAMTAIALAASLLAARRTVAMPIADALAHT